MLLTTCRDSDAVAVVRRARLRDRLAARWRTTRLDGELARGIEPGTSAALALRARALGEHTARTALAQGLCLALSDARQGSRPPGARLPVRHREVLAAAAELDALAERLVAPGPVGARGLAEVSRLLRDGASPLYWRGAAENLRAVAVRALDGLEPRLEW
ncbi:MAG: hypothetical protein JO325_09245 [Solirubrobacterales bacterium]|nr:hypothetical protein [Solirubrobacterales bacterium]